MKPNGPRPTDLPRFAAGQVLTNEELSDAFGGGEGGIRFRGSTMTHIDRMAIIQPSTGRHPYREQRDGDVLIYMGQGRRGDQQMTNRNLALAQHLAQGFPLFAFTRDAVDSYECLEPAVVEQVTEGRAPDDDGKDRLVYLLTIRILQDGTPQPPARILPLPTTPAGAGRRHRRAPQPKDLRKYEKELAHARTWSSRALRSRALVEALKSLYGYRCQLCGSDAAIPPIPTTGAKFYVEVHHVWGFLEAIGGDQVNGVPLVDRSDNIIVVCPHHHALLHYRRPTIHFDSERGGFVDGIGLAIPLALRLHEVSGAERYRDK